MSHTIRHLLPSIKATTVNSWLDNVMFNESAQVE